MHPHRLVLLLALTGCTDPSADKSPGDPSGTTAVDSGTPGTGDDTGDPEDSGDTGDTGDTGEEVNPHLVAPGIFRMEGLDPELPRDDLAALAQVVDGAQVVALGESIHFSGGYHEVRARMIPHLVEDLGYRVVAFEGPWGAAEASRRYVEQCDGSFEDAMRGLTFSVWQSPSSAHTLQWLCDWNTAHPDDPVSFFGFDIQEPWHDGPFLRDLLHAASDEPADLLTGLEACVAGGLSVPGAFWDTEDGQAFLEGRFPIPGLAERTDDCRAGLAAVETWLEGHTVEVTEARSADHIVQARAALVALEAAHVQFSSETLDVAGWNARDAGMAEVFELLWRERNGGEPAVIWAHNAHIVARGEELDDSPYPEGWVDMGSIPGGRLGDDYAPIGFIASEVAWSWPGMEGTSTAGEGSLESVLDGVGESLLLVDLPAAVADGTGIAADTAYTAGHPAQATFVPADHYRGLVYLQTSDPMEFWP